MTYIRFVAVAVSMIAVLAPGGIAYAQRAAESATASSQAIVPFKIQVPDAVLTDLKRRLAQARFADEFPDAGWDYGTNLAYLKSLVGYWRGKKNWRGQQKKREPTSPNQTKKPPPPTPLPPPPAAKTHPTPPP